jgi:histidyl-tRNA synthetase
MGGPNVAALGFGMGIERLMLVLEAQKTALPKINTCDLYIATMGEAAALKASELCANLRNDGFKVQTDIVSRGLKAQMKYADKIGASFTMVLGDNEIETGNAKLKDMQSGKETAICLNNISDELFSAITDAALEQLEEAIIE